MHDVNGNQNNQAIKIKCLWQEGFDNNTLKYIFLNIKVFQNHFKNTGNWEFLSCNNYNLGTPFWRSI